MRVPQVALMLGVASLILGPAAPSPGQSSDDTQKMRKDIEALKEGQKLLQRDLEDIKALLRARAAPPSAPGPGDTLPQPIVLKIDDAPFLGRRDAKITIVEFSDFQCPFCARYSQQTLPTIVKEYVDTGKVKYVLRDFPIAALHPSARKSHEAAHCAGDQGKYWEMHHRLFANIRGHELPQLLAHARALRLDVNTFERCVTSGRHEATITKAVEEGQRAGVRGTPSFFVGTSGDGQAVKAARMIRGAQPYDRFKAVIDAALAGAR